MSSEPQRSRLPFEPAGNKKKSAKSRTENQATATQEEKARPASKEEMSIPKAVSNRMARRMALFSGIPTALGMLTFIVSYWIVIHQWFNLPNAVVVLVSVGFFGLGVLGLSYGVLSASWEEDEPGSKLGWTEFTTNWGRMTAAWQSAKKKE